MTTEQWKLVTDAFTAAGTSLTGNIVSLLIVLVPVVLGVVGLTIAIRFGLKFFKSARG